MKLLLLPIIFALLGFVFSSKQFIRNYNKLSPYTGLLVYYAILFIVIWVLQRVGLVIGGESFTSLRHAIGSMFVIFAFFVIVDWESCWVNYVTKNHCDENKVSNVYMMSEDGALFDLWSKVFKNKNTVRLFTYVLSPFLLCLIGLALLNTHVGPNLSVLN